MSESLAEKYYFMWRDAVANRKYREWQELQDEINEEREYATKHLESEHWCWNCQHFECDRHDIKVKCAGKTQRGRNCHVHVSTFRNGLFFCKYHF